MFSNPVYNLPPQFNEKLLAQNLAGLSLNPGQSHPDQEQQGNIDFGSYQFSPQSQHIPLDIGGYAPPQLSESDTKWPSPDDVNVSYQRGSTVVRQYNNSMIDDYYKKYTRPITDYVAIPTNGQPTYVYQTLGGQQQGTTAPALGQVPGSGGEVPVETSAAAPSLAAQTTADGTEERKHKKKHKKRSSKHGHGESEKVADERKHETTSHVEHHHHQQTPHVAPTGNVIHQQQVAPVPAATPAATGDHQVPMKLESNPVVFFDIEIDDDARGRLVMELYRHVLPRTAQNFLALSSNEHGFGYRLSYFHRIIPGFMAQGGDFEKSNGTGGYSIYGEKFDDEGFPYPHDRPGLLSMANSGPNTNGSQFFITFEACPHLDKKHVVFGQVLQGFHILKDLELSGSDDGEVSREVKIANSGQLQ